MGKIYEAWNIVIGEGGEEFGNWGFGDFVKGDNLASCWWDEFSWFGK